MIEFLIAFALGVCVGAALVASYARRIIQRIRKDWQTANAVRSPRRET